MRLIEEPQVILASCNSLIGSTSVLEYTNLSTDIYCSNSALDSIPEVAGRLCYQSFKNPRPGGQKTYLKNVLEMGHGSILEHSYVGFIFTGISRSLTHEMIRHRAGTAFSELSQRYYEPDDVGFVLPPLAIEDENQKTYFAASFQSAWEEYQSAVVAGIQYESERWLMANPGVHADKKDLTLIRKRARESARAILPNATETHMFMTANLRAWRHIIALRGSIHADLEIRRLAVVIADRLKELAPNCMQDVSIVVDVDGRKSVVLEYPKV